MRTAPSMGGNTRGCRATPALLAGSPAAAVPLEDAVQVAASVAYSAFCACGSCAALQHREGCATRPLVARLCREDGTAAEQQRDGHAADGQGADHDGHGSASLHAGEERA